MTKKDKNAAVRLQWEVWKALDLIRADRTVRTNRKTSLSDIIREAIDHYLGKGTQCQTKKDH
jgi:predicted DNA-binding protein